MHGVLKGEIQIPLTRVELCERACMSYQKDLKCLSVAHEPAPM